MEKLAIYTSTPSQILPEIVSMLTSPEISFTHVNKLSENAILVTMICKYMNFLI